MMQKFLGLILVVLILSSCNCNNRSTSREYMPDMSYSPAIQTYSDLAYLAKEGINYNATPVAGTVSRGDALEYSFSIPKDKVGELKFYELSKQVPNPIQSMNASETKEAERLYLIYCGICHGKALDGNGPLFNKGDGAYASAPRNFMTDPVVTNMPHGQMFYSVTYGKNNMGSYASQLSEHQRWMIISYIKSKQKGN